MHRVGKLAVINFYFFFLIFPAWPQGFIFLGLAPDSLSVLAPQPPAVPQKQNIQQAPVGKNG